MARRYMDGFDHHTKLPAWPAAPQRDPNEPSRIRVGVHPTTVLLAWFPDGRVTRDGHEITQEQAQAICDEYGAVLIAPHVKRRSRPR
jgi:hypothetical protein